MGSGDPTTAPQDKREPSDSSESPVRATTQRAASSSEAECCYLGQAGLHGHRVVLDGARRQLLLLLQLTMTYSLAFMRFCRSACAARNFLSSK